MSNIGSAATGTYITSTVHPSKVPDMPESMSHLDPTEILKAAAAIQHSRIKWPVDAINSLSESNAVLKDWEIRQVETAFANFLAKHNSPLAKALK